MKRRKYIRVIAREGLEWFVVVTWLDTGVEKQYGPMPPREAVYWYDKLKHGLKRKALPPAPPTGKPASKK